MNIELNDKAIELNHKDITLRFWKSQVRFPTHTINMKFGWLFVCLFGFSKVVGLKSHVRMDPTQLLLQFPFMVWRLATMWPKCSMHLNEMISIFFWKVLKWFFFFKQYLNDYWIFECNERTYKKKNSTKVCACGSIYPYAMHGGWGKESPEKWKP